MNYWIANYFFYIVILYQPGQVPQGGAAKEGQGAGRGGEGGEEEEKRAGSRRREGGVGGLVIGDNPGDRRSC